MQKRRPQEKKIGKKFETNLMKIKVELEVGGGNGGEEIVPTCCKLGCPNGNV